MTLTHVDMASSRKRQEDKNLKILRELVTQTHNKKCFDCGQRGPTYVNMTIGAFVCTSCSGLLRGLNPPHRIKSISMASFNQQEIEFLQKHGNQVCQNTWLALWEHASMENESREEQKMKDHLVHKYERKVWYSDQKPNPVMNQPEEPVARPLKTLLGNSIQVIVSTEAQQKPPAIISTAPISNAAQFEQHKPPRNTSMDLLGNFGSDPFASTAPPINKPAAPIVFQQPVQPVVQQTPPLFDAFTSSDDSKNEDSFDLFVNSKPNPPLATNPSLPSTTPPVSIGNGSVDKYAALVELDMSNTQSVFSSSSVFGSSPASSVAATTTQPNPFMSPSISSSGAAVFQQQQQKPVNPFQSSTVTPAVPNSSIFSSVAPPAAEIPHQTPLFNNWDMSNTSMNLNSVPPNSTMPISGAMAPNQPNSNFAFGGAPTHVPPNNEFMSQMNMTGQANIVAQPNQNAAFSSQPSLFPNPLGFPNQAGFGANQFNTQQQKPQQLPQQAMAAAVPRQQTLYHQQFPNQTQYNFTMDNTQTSQIPTQPMFNANFQQFPSNVVPNQMPKNPTPQLHDHQSLFGAPASTPFNQPVKSTNPFM